MSKTTLCKIVDQKVEAIQISLTDKWINKMWYIYMIDYYPTIKRNEIMIYVTTQIDLETSC